MFSKTIQSSAFFDQLSKDDNKTWKDEKGQEVLTYFNRSILTYIGKPALKMLRFVITMFPRYLLKLSTSTILDSVVLCFKIFRWICD